LSLINLEKKKNNKKEKNKEIEEYEKVGGSFYKNFKEINEDELKKSSWLH
jgi:hypothetical protein